MASNEMLTECTASVEPTIDLLPAEQEPESTSDLFIQAEDENGIYLVHKKNISNSHDDVKKLPPGLVTEEQLNSRHEDAAIAEFIKEPAAVEYSELPNLKKYMLLLGDGKEIYQGIVAYHNNTAHIGKKGENKDVKQVEESEKLSDNSCTSELVSSSDTCTYGMSIAEMNLELEFSKTTQISLIKMLRALEDNLASFHVDQYLRLMISITEAIGKNVAFNHETPKARDKRLLKEIQDLHIFVSVFNQVVVEEEVMSSERLLNAFPKNEGLAKDFLQVLKAVVRKKENEKEICTFPVYTPEMKGVKREPRCYHDW